MAEYEKAGRNADALAIYREFPGNAAAKERVGRLLAASGDFAAAIPGLESAVRQSPSVANRLALADAYKMNKQMDQAIEQLRLAEASEPGNYDVRMDLGRELRDRRQFVAAPEQFAAARRSSPLPSKHGTNWPLFR